MLAEHLPELPGMFDRAGRPDRLVAPEHDQRRESVLVRALRVRETVLDRVLGREKGDDPFARNVSTEVRHEMAEIVFFLRTDRAVGQEHECTLTAQAAHGVIGVDPCVHALVRCQFGPRRPQLRCNDGGTGLQGREQSFNAQRSTLNLQLSTYNSQLTTLNLQLRPQLYNSRVSILKFGPLSLEL